ncbi:hypothetical protein ACFYXV_26835 [Streptomyces sp. NPDC002181]|uniref:hypothetical protein n=1 Tax=Streptomyces sp. NPDC002181 TaxID=3364635 RepID=UPI003673F37E
MSTPEEQQQQQQHQQQRQEPDPYGTQTWQSDTWETGYQPVQQAQAQAQAQAQPPLGALPGQPVAPEGWFRDEAPAAQPQGWPRPEAAAPEQPAYPSPQQPVAPEGWFREEPPAAGWAPGAGAWADGSAAEQTAYLPPQGAAPAAGAAEQTAYLPPYPGAEGGLGAAAAAETAYLPPYPGPGAAEPQAAAGSPYPAAADGPQARAVAPEGWFRDEAPAAQAPAPAPAADWREAPAGSGSAAEQTAYLPPQAAAEQTAFLPPYAGTAAADTPYPGTGTGAGAEEPAPGADGEEPAYSPPTLGGNTVRAVDPAQARAEGRSPIIDPGPQPAILTAALGLLLAGAAAVGELALLGPLIVLQALTAAGWFRLNGMWPARQGIALAFLGALVADAAVLAVDDAYGPGAIIGTLGAWVLLTLVLQLRSHADPDERMYGLMASVASAALAIVCAGYLAAGSAAVSVGAAAVAVAVFARALPLPTPASVGVSLAAATGAGIAVGGLTSVGVGGALLGLAAGVCALIGLRVAAYDYPSKFVHMTAGVALPLAAAAPAVYLIGRVVG